MNPIQNQGKFDWPGTLKFVIPLTLGVIISAYSVRMSLELQIHDIQHTVKANQKHMGRLRVEAEAALGDLRRDLRAHIADGVGGIPHPHVFTLRLKQVEERLSRHRYRFDRLEGLEPPAPK